MDVTSNIFVIDISNIETKQTNGFFNDYTS